MCRRDDRDREDRAEDAAEQPAAGQGEHDRHRMQAYRTPDDERLQQVCLDLVLQQQDGEQDDRGQETLRDQGDQHGEAAEDQCADDGDEASDEDHHRQGHGERHAEEEQDRPDDHPVEQRDERGADDPAGQHVPGAVAGAADARLDHAREQPDRPRPHPVALLEEEEGDEEHDDESGDDLAEHGPCAQQTGRDHLGVLLQGADGTVLQVLQLNVVRSREVLQVAAELAGQAVDLADELRVVGGGLLGHEVADGREDQERDEEGSPGRQRAGEPQPPQHMHERMQQGRQQQGEEDGQHDEVETPEERDQGQERRRDQQDPPAPRGRDGQPDRNGGSPRHSRLRRHVPAPLDCHRRHPPEDSRS